MPSSVKTEIKDQKSLQQAVMRVAYFANDLSDSTVHKRVAMLLRVGIQPIVFGFRRGAQPVSEIHGLPVTELGRTFNLRYSQRVAAVLKVAWALRRGTLKVPRVDVVLARNMEMLALGNVVASRQGTPVFYELLDLHRFLLEPGLKGRAMRAIEGSLARRARGVLTSSPDYIENYLQTRARYRLPTLLVENKLLLEPSDFTIPPAPSPGPPWRIVYAGILRCRKSLLMLSDLGQQAAGKVEVHLWGKPALDVIPDFHALVDASDALQFKGSYTNPEGLSDVYRGAHFAWVVDFFEEGLNARWALSNRSYESGLFGVVPLVQSGQAMGRHAERLGIGVVLGETFCTSLQEYFAGLAAEQWQRLSAATRAVAKNQWLLTQDDCDALRAFLESPFDGEQS